MQFGGAHLPKDRDARNTANSETGGCPIDKEQPSLDSWASPLSSGSRDFGLLFRASQNIIQFPDERLPVLVMTVVSRAAKEAMIVHLLGPFLGHDNHAALRFQH